VIHLQYDPVTEDVLGRKIEGQVYYHVYHRLRSGPRATERWAEDGYTEDLFLDVSNLEPGESYEFKLQSWLVPHKSDWVYLTVATASDVESPPKPSAPVLSTRAGTVSASWDGNMADGSSSWPFDMVGVNVYVDGEIRLRFRDVVRDGVVGAFEPGTIVNAWLTAVDAWGNESESSDIASVTVASVITEDDLNSMRGVIDDMVASADGKSQVYWSRERPVGDTFPLGATWFQYSDNEARNIVGMYRWDGEDWRESTGFSHEVLASLDLGKATIGELEGNRIKANSIESDRLIVDQALADRVMANVVIADHIDAGSITSAMITSDTISGKTFSGSEFTGGLIQTSPEANTGIKINLAGKNRLQAWDATHALLVDIDANNGTVSFGDKFKLNSDGTLAIAGDLTTSTGTSRIHIHGAPSGGGYDSAIDFITGGLYDTPVLQGGYNPWTGHNREALYIRSGRIIQSAYVSFLALSQDRGAQIGYSAPDGTSTVSSLYKASGVTTDTMKGAIENYSTSWRWSPFTGAQLGWYFTEPNAAFRFLDRENSGNSRARVQHMTNETPMMMNPYGFIGVSSSLSKYKLDQKPMEFDWDHALDLEPKTWIDRSEQEIVDSNFEGTGANMVLQRVPGLVVEDLQELGGFDEFLTVDFNGKPTGIYYDRLWLTLIPVVKKLKARVEELEERIDNGHAA